MPWKPIQSATNGLLSLLSLKNVGRNPDALMESVQPILDMLPFYTSSQSRGLSLSPALANNGLGFVTLYQVPLDRAVILQHISVGIFETVTPPAGDIVEVYPAIAYRLGQPTQQSHYGPSPARYVSLGAAVATRALATWSGPVFVPPGGALGAFVNIAQITGGGVMGMTVAAEFVDLLV